jgi:hypothetical protein
MPKARVHRHGVVQPQDQSIRLIPLTQGQNAIVDAEDFEWLDQWNWCAAWMPHTRSFYAVRVEPDKSVTYMARKILECAPGQEVDHANHDTLDNRRQNLRKATHAQNVCNRKPQKNSSGYVGVSWESAQRKWRAGIKHAGVSMNLGNFDSAEEAARVRDEAAKRLHGEFAVLNFS